MVAGFDGLKRENGRMSGICMDDGSFEYRDLAYLSDEGGCCRYLS